MTNLGPILCGIVQHPPHAQIESQGDISVHGIFNMSCRAGFLSALFFLSTNTYADNSIVIGRGIKVDEVAGSGDWSSEYVWQINARRTLSGPTVKGAVRIVAASHAQPKDSYVRTIELFVLAPVIQSKTESTVEPGFSLIASSPLYKRRKYCIPFKPVEVSIPLDDSEVQRDDHGFYCFTKKALLKAAHL